MAKVREQPQDRDRIVRARKTCLRLCGRVYADGTGVYVVTGKPDGSRLLDCLTDHSDYEGWTPSTLGFSSGQIQKISKTYLTEVGRALTKWQKVLVDKDARKARTKANAREIKEWKKEIAEAAKRLKLLHGLLKESAAMQGKAASYVTEDMARVDIKGIYDQLLPGKSIAKNVQQCVHAAEWLPERLRWSGAMAFWVGGLEALERFARFIDPCLHRSLRDVWAGIIGLDADRKNSLRVAAHNNDCHGEKALKYYFGGAAALCAHDGSLSGMPRCLFRPTQGTRPSEVTFEEDYFKYDVHHYGWIRCDWTPDAYASEVSEEDGYRRHSDEYGGEYCLRDSSIANLDYQDDSGDYVSKGYFYNGEQSTLKNLAEESTQKGYDKLLDFLSRQNASPDSNLFSSIRKLLHAGETAEDVGWLLHRGYAGQFAGKGLSALPLRLLIARVESLGGTCSEDNILSALDFTLKAGNTAFAAAFLEWTNALASKPDPQLAQGTWNTFIEALVLSRMGRRSGDRLRRWTVKPRKLSMPGTEELALSDNVQRGLTRLAYYQKLAGLEPGLTKSIRRLLARTHKPNQAKAAEEKLLRQIQEVCAHVALDGVKDMVKEELANLLGNLCKRPPTFQPSLNQSLAIVDWIQSLDKADREKLDELLAAWDEAGPEYRARLTGNAKWMDWAKKTESIQTEHQSEQQQSGLKRLLAMSVNEIELSVRAANCLNNANITTVGQLATKTEADMLKYRNFGKKSFNEIKDKLVELELGLGMTFDEDVLDPSALAGQVEKWLAPRGAKECFAGQVEEWLAPKPAIRKRKGVAYHVEVATDPFRVFLMGNYFGSCLSLPNGENRHSVLANAYEVNKAVVFVYDTKGNVLSRKLVGINQDSNLVGYNTYISTNDENERDVIWRIVDFYCKAWAKRAGVEISNDGDSPEELTDLFWYDDGVESWGRAPNPAKASEWAEKERRRAEALRKAQEFPF